MKINKKVTASDLLEGEELRTTEGECPVEDAVPGVDPKACAREHIMEAIKCLSKIAQTDPVAKDSIANLAVVSFDLQ